MGIFMCDKYVLSSINIDEVEVWAWFLNTYASSFLAINSILYVFCTCLIVYIGTGVDEIMYDDSL